MDKEERESVPRVTMGEEERLFLSLSYPFHTCTNEKPKTRPKPNAVAHVEAHVHGARHLGSMLAAVDFDFLGLSQQLIKCITYNFIVGQCHGMSKLPKVKPKEAINPHRALMDHFEHFGVNDIILISNFAQSP